MDASIIKEQAIDVIINEAAALDHRQWDDWINLYTEDATYWMPAWVDEHVTTNDPSNSRVVLWIKGEVKVN